MNLEFDDSKLSFFRELASSSDEESDNEKAEPTLKDFAEAAKALGIEPHNPKNPVGIERVPPGSVTRNVTNHSSDVEDEVEEGWTTVRTKKPKTHNIVKKVDKKQSVVDKDSFSDRSLNCKDCKEDFIFVAKQQHFFAINNWEDPTRCYKCRRQKKYLRSIEKTKLAQKNEDTNSGEFPENENTEVITIDNNTDEN